MQPARLLLKSPKSVASSRRGRSNFEEQYRQTSTAHVPASNLHIHTCALPVKLWTLSLHTCIITYVCIWWFPEIYCNPCYGDPQKVSLILRNPKPHKSLYIYICICDPYMTPLIPLKNIPNLGKPPYIRLPQQGNKVSVNKFKTTRVFGFRDLNPKPSALPPIPTQKPQTLSPTCRKP